MPMVRAVGIGCKGSLAEHLHNSQLRLKPTESVSTAQKKRTDGVGSLNFPFLSADYGGNLDDTQTPLQPCAAHSLSLPY